MPENPLTFTRFRSYLIDGYRKEPGRVSRDELNERLEATVFGPYQEFTERIARLKEIANEVTSTESPLNDGDKLSRVIEFQDLVERILVVYQHTMLEVPNDIMEDA